MTATETYAILVLNDGETWSEIDGASICIIDRRTYNDLCDGSEEPHTINPMFEMGLRDYTFTTNSERRSER